MKYQAPWIGQSEQEYNSVRNGSYAIKDNDEVPEPYRCNIFKKQCDTCVMRSCTKHCRSCSALSINKQNAYDYCACIRMPDDGEMSCKYYIENKESQK